MCLNPDQSNQNRWLTSQQILPNQPPQRGLQHKQSSLTSKPHDHSHIHSFDAYNLFPPFYCLPKGKPASFPRQAPWEASSPTQPGVCTRSLGLDQKPLPTQRMGLLETWRSLQFTLSSRFSVQFSLFSLTVSALLISNLENSECPVEKILPS